MADFPYIPVKLKEQGKVLRFHVGIFHQYLIGIQFLLQYIGTETLRHHCQLQVSLIAHVVGDGVIGIPIRIKIGRFSIRIKGQGHRTRHRNGLRKAERAILRHRKQRIVYVADIKFNLIFLRHGSYPPFQTDIGLHIAFRYQSMFRTLYRRCRGHPAHPPVSVPPSSP